MLCELAGIPKKYWKTTQQSAPYSFCDTVRCTFYSQRETSRADWLSLVFAPLSRKMGWVDPARATFLQNCTLIFDMYPVLSEDETLLLAILPARVTSRFHQRCPKCTYVCAKHTVGTARTDLTRPSTSTLHAHDIQWLVYPIYGRGTLAGKLQINQPTATPKNTLLLVLLLL